MKKIFLILVTLFGALALGNTTYAGFSLTGSTITQTGTDTDLSGLAGISGVTFENWGYSTAVVLDGRKLLIKGNLSFDDTTSFLVFKSNCPNRPLHIDNGGKLVINSPVVEYGQTTYKGGQSIRFNKSIGSNWSAGNMHIYVANGGALELYGTSIQFRKGGFWSESNANILIRDSAFLGADESRVYLVTSKNNADIDGLVVDQFNAFNIQGTPSAEPLNLQIQNSDWGIFSNKSNNDTNLYSYQSLTTDYDTVSGLNSRNNFYNRVGGSKDFRSVGRANNVNGKTMNNRLFQTMRIEAVDVLGSALDGVFYLKDDVDANAKDSTHAVFAENYSNNRTYIENIASGYTNYFDLLIASQVQNGNESTLHLIQGPGSYTDTPLSLSYRSKSGTDADDFSGYVWNYNKQNARVNFNANSKEDLTVTAILVEDSNITETTQATVDAYTDIDSLEKLYDRAKSYKLDNLEYPAIQWQVVDGNGSDINLGSKNLVVDGTASSAFAVNQGTNTITIKASAMSCVGDKFTSLTTTGTVSFVNGGSAGDCIFIDSSGTNGVLTLTDLDQANVLVYDDASAADDTISYQTNQSGDLVIPFSPTSSTDYQVVVRKPGFSEVNFEFDPSGGGNFSFPINQNQALTIEGSAIYQNTGDVSKITMDFVNKKINLGDFVLPAQEVYDTLQDIEVTEAAMKFERIANFDGASKLLLLNGYQFRNRDGAATVPGVNAFVFAETGGVLDASNGSVQFLTTPTASVNKQEQIIAMLESIQGSDWDNTNVDDFDRDEVNLTSIAGDGFDTTIHALSKQVDHMLERGIVDINTLKDLLE